MKRIVREFEYSAAEREKVSELARAMGVTETLSGILYARGVDTKEKMEEFLHPSCANFLSPYLMRGMREAKELIETARNEGWRVAVFGDYDADGVGALAVLSRALKIYGIDPYLYIPERAEGYGMSIAAIDAIFDEFLPDLIITVDCGISNRKEVEYIKELGAECIVTDHHELPDALPDCIVIDPKLNDDYPYDNLCGAGVAFKLATALIGAQANALLDLAALSTVADSVPLLGENRIIVAEGLRMMQKSPRPAFAALLGKSAEVTAQTLAFSVAPRVNAAGRMGDAHAALALFTSEDGGEIYELAAKLNSYNTERQKYCDALYADAEAQIAREGAYDSVVMLAGEDWNTGFVGIVAARLAEEYSRPALLFVRHGDKLKGSARSIQSINIFDALKGCSAYIEEFGGHAQAAGVNLTAENFSDLKAALDAYLKAHYSQADFLPELVVSGEGTEDFRETAKELAMLEPCGMGNRRPLFAVRAGKMQVFPLKPDSPHLTMNIGGMDFVYFNGIKERGILESDLEKQIVFEYNLSHFRGKEYVKGFVRFVAADGMSGSEVELDALERRLHALGESKASPVGEAQFSALIEEKLASCPYGTCCVVYDRQILSRFPALKGLPVESFHLTSAGAENTVLFAPEAADLSMFRDVFLLDSDKIDCGNARLWKISDPISPFSQLDCTRETLLSVFAALRGREGADVGESAASAAKKLDLPFPKEEIVFALAVFEELGLISRERGRLTIARGKKTDLNFSTIYTAVRRRKGE